MESSGCETIGKKIGEVVIPVHLGKGDGVMDF